MVEARSGVHSSAGAVTAERLRHDSDHGVRLARRRIERPTIAGRPEAPAPQAVGEHDDLRAALDVLVGGEAATEGGRHAEHPEEARPDPLLVDVVALPSANRLTPVTQSE